MRLSALFLMIFLTALNNALLFSQAKDILEVKRFQISNTAVLDFTPQGRYSLVASDSNTLSLLHVKTGAVVKKRYDDYIQNTEKIIISPNNSLALLVNKNSINLWSVDSLNHLYKFLKNGAQDITFSADSRYYATTKKDNTVDLIDLITKQGETIEIPEYLNGKPYTTKINKCFFDRKKSLLYLIDVGFAEELSTFRSGLHINIIPYDLKTRKHLAPIPIYHSNAKTLTPIDYSNAAFTPDQRFMIFCFKNKLLYYDMVTKKLKESPNLEMVEDFSFESSGRFMMTSGVHSSILWEITPNKTFRQLKLFLAGALKTTFSQDGKYVVAWTPDKATFIIWDIKEAQNIRVNPSKYIQRAAQKYSQIKYQEWLSKNAAMKSPKKEKITPLTQSLKSRELLAFAVDKFSEEVFRVGVDYLYINVNDNGYFKIQTDGFTPIKFYIPDSLEQRKFLDFFSKGSYKWLNTKFTIDEEELVINFADLKMNYGRTYSYDFTTDPDAAKYREKAFLIEFANYNLNENIDEDQENNDSEQKP